MAASATPPAAAPAPASDGDGGRLLSPVVRRLINEHGKCSHFRVDFQEHRIEEIDLPIHWLSCPPRSALDTARAELAFRMKQVP